MTIPQPIYGKKLSVAVSGGMGFIGSHIVDYCQKAGWDVDVWDIKNGRDVRLFGLCETKKFDVIFHLAAQASIPKSEENPIESHGHNVIGTLKVLEYARKSGSKIVFSSSSSVYALDSPYSLQKKQCEEYLDFYRKYGVRSCALRYFNVFGERQELANEGYSLVLSRFLQQHKDGVPFTIYGTGKQRRDFVYINDVVSANILAIDQKGVFDVGRGENTSVNELTDMIDPTHPREHLPPRKEVFANKAERSKWLPGWEPTISIKQWYEKSDYRKR
jgi:UDP-glucose 4-epimerase